LPEPRPGASFYSRPELGRFEIPLGGEQEWVDFLTLSLADWLEQVRLGLGYPQIAYGKKVLLLGLPAGFVVMRLPGQVCLGLGYP
jgi:hypothetical protein